MPAKKKSMSLEQEIEDQFVPGMSLCCDCGVTDVGDWDMANNCWYCEHCWRLFFEKNPVKKRKYKKMERHPDPFVKSSVRADNWYHRRIVAITNTVKSVWGLYISDLLIQEIFYFCFNEQGLSLQWVGKKIDPGTIFINNRVTQRTQFLVSFVKPMTILRLRLVWHVTRNLKRNLLSHKIPLAKIVKLEARFNKGSRRARKIWVVLWEGVPQTDCKSVEHRQLTASVEAFFFPPLTSVSVLRITCPPKQNREYFQGEKSMEKQLRYATLAMVSV